MNKLTRNLIVVIVVLVFALGFVYFFTKKPAAPVSTSTVSTGEYSWKLVKPSQSGYEVDVYLTGTDVPNVSAIELDGKLDSPLLKLASAEQGGFYENPLVIKMDTDNLVFAVAKSPANQTPIDPSQPVFKLFFEPQSGFSQAAFDIIPKSLIYIKNTGGNSPAVTQIVIQK